jgi:hypothetical protein
MHVNGKFSKGRAVAQVVSRQPPTAEALAPGPGSKWDVWRATYEQSASSYYWVSIVSYYKLNYRGSIPGWGKGFFL